MKNSSRSVGYSIFLWVKRQVWSLIVAYMIGLHNFYYGDNKNPDNIKITVEKQEKPGNANPGNGDDAIK